MTLGEYTVSLTATDVWLALVLLAVVGTLAFRAYRPSPLAGRLALTLFAVRLCLLILAVALLMAPRLTVSANGVRLPLIAVLVDDSESMRILSGDRPRFEVVEDLLASGTFDMLENRARVQMFRFSERLLETEPTDTAGWLGPATDIATSLDQLSTRLRGEGLAGVVLISDGAHNLGQSPVQTIDDLSASVYPVLVGAGQPPVDVALTTATHASLGYVGRPMNVEVRLESVGLDRTDHLIRIYDGDRVVAVSPISIRSGRQDVVVTVTPDRPGVRLLRVVVPPIEGEAEISNNEVLSEIEVLTSRASVLLLGTPSDDFAFVRRVIEADSNVAVQVIYPDSPQGWGYDARSALSAVETHDLVVLHDVPSALLTSDIQAALSDRVRSGGGLLVVGGGASIVRSLPVLPVEQETSGYRTGTFGGRLTAAAERHPVTRISVDAAADRDAWSNLPPFTGVEGVSVRERTGSQVLVETEAGDPLVVVANVDQGKVVVVAARGFARQARMMWGIGETDRTVRSFWSNAVRWLLTRESVRKLRVTTDREIYRSGEPITFRVEYFDDLLRPTDGAEVLLEVENAHTGVSIVPGRGNGVYEVRSPGLPQGRHAFRVTAQVEGGDEETYDGDITVGRYSVEFENLLANASLMEALARRSGGRLLQPADLAEFLQDMKLSPQPHVSVRRFDLWGKQWPLALLVVGFTFEWFVRRRRGML